MVRKMGTGDDGQVVWLVFFSDFVHNSCMGKKRMLILAVLTVTLLGVVVWSAVEAYNPEPCYRSRPLSYWLGEYGIYWPVDLQWREDEAAEAIRAIGTNAIPRYLQMLRSKDTALKLEFITLAQKQHLVEIPYTPDHTQHQEAADGFGLLGADASNAVPALIEIYEKGISRDSQHYTVFSLGAIGPAAARAVPVLLREAKEGDSAARLWAVGALGRLHAEPDLVVPALIALSQDSDNNMKVVAIRALGDIGTGAKSAIPQLKELEKVPVFKSDAREALQKIDPGVPAEPQKNPSPSEPDSDP